MGWYEDRFKPHPTRVQCACAACGRAYWLPKSEAPRRTTCGEKCRLELGRQAKEQRRRPCEHCGATFIPRTTQLAVGEGRFCSVSCSIRFNCQLWTPQARTRAAEALNDAIQAARYVPPKGPVHHQWAGGPAATTRRRILSGKAKRYTTVYRAANPHKVKEFAQRRSTRKLGRLPRGTVSRLGAVQRWRCAVCRGDLRHRFHLDHIEPLARGGHHAPWNLQLLCPPCNVRKAAKDPISFMQERGFLL